MITKLNHVSLFVLDQERTYDFYVNKLGFKVNTDAEMGAKGRWLTVNPPDQLDVELTLIAIDEKMMFDKESAETMRRLVSAGTFGFAAFECDDILATYEELKAKGVHFKKNPPRNSTDFPPSFRMIQATGFHSAKNKRRNKNILNKLSN